MKKHAPRTDSSLRLHRETLHRLESRQLKQIAGALPPTECCHNTLECSPSCRDC